MLGQYKFYQICSAVGRTTALAASFCLCLSAAARAEEAIGSCHSVYRVQPADTSCEIVLRKEPTLARAWSIVRGMEDSIERDSILIEIAKTYASKDFIEDANNLLDSIVGDVEAGFEKVEYETLTEAANVYAVMGERDRAIALLERSLASIEAMDEKDDPLLKMISVLEDIEDDFVALAGLNGITQMLSELEELAYPELIVERLATAFSHLEDVDAGNTGVAQAAQLARNWGLFRFTDELGLLSIAEAYGRLGNSTAAAATLRQFEALGSWQDFDTHHWLAKVAAIYAQIGEVDAANGLLNRAQMLMHNETLHPAVLSTLTEDAMFAYIELGDEEKVQQILRSILPAVADKSSSEAAATLISTHLNAAEVYAKQGNASRAQAMLQQAVNIYRSAISNSDYAGWRALTIDDMIATYDRLEGESADEVLAFVMRDLDEVYWPSQHPPYLGIVAQAASRKDDAKLVTQLFKQSLRSFEDNGLERGEIYRQAQIENLASFATTYGQSSDLLASVNRLRSLTQAAERIEDADLRRALLKAIAIAYADLA